MSDSPNLRFSDQSNLFSFDFRYNLHFQNLHCSRHTKRRFNKFLIKFIEAEVRPNYMQSILQSTLLQVLAVTWQNL